VKPFFAVCFGFIVPTPVLRKHAITEQAVGVIVISVHIIVSNNEECFFGFRLGITTSFFVLHFIHNFF
jgi:hypothetical protein